MIPPHDRLSSVPALVLQHFICVGSQDRYVPFLRSVHFVSLTSVTRSRPRAHGFVFGGFNDLQIASVRLGCCSGCLAGGQVPRLPRSNFLCVTSENSNRRRHLPFHFSGH